MKWLIFVLLQLGTVFGNVGTTPNTYYGEFSVLSFSASHIQQQDDAYKYWLKTDNNSIYGLTFNTPLSDEDISTGDAGYVIGYETKPNHLNVISYFISELYGLRYTSDGDLTAQAQNTQISTLVFVLQVCSNVPFDITRLNRIWTNKRAGSDTVNTLQNYFDSCSYGKIEFKDENQLILGPIDLGIPCNANCSQVLLYIKVKEALEYAMKQGVDVNRYRHKMFMLPANLRCGWAGVGEMKCGNSCNSWYYSSYGLETNTIMHELGHNLGLHHSSTFYDEYGDGSCAMGGCCGNRCYSVPQSWRLGLTFPMVVYNQSNFVPGSIYSHTIPAHLVTETNFIHIINDWNITSSDVRSYAISYRIGIGYDVNLAAGYKNKVYIHRVRRSSYLDGRVFLLAVMSQGTTHNIVNESISVTFIGTSQDGKSANIMLCRYNNSTPCFFFPNLPPAPPRPPPPSPVTHSSPPPRSPIPSPSPLPPVTQRPPHPPSNLIRYRVSIRVPLNISDTYIQSILCPMLRNAIQKRLDNIPNICNTASAISAKYYTVSFDIFPTRFYLIRTYVAALTPIFTQDAGILCDSTISVFDPERVILTYKASKATCVTLFT
jgi:hypothetical protein